MQIPFQSVPYRGPSERSERCRLDVHVPEGFNGGATLVWFYGGGLMDGERHLPQELRDQEFAVVTPDYRLSPGVRCPSYLRDAAAATAWTFAHAREFGGDPDRIFIGGASAGAYLASLITLDKRWLASLQVDADRLLGLVSLTAQLITHFTVRAERGIAGHRAVVDEFAPLFHVRPDAPPILLVTGDRELELLGRYEETAYFQRMLRLAGHTENELHELPGKDHGGVEAPGHALGLAFMRKILTVLAVPCA